MVFKTSHTGAVAPDLRASQGTIIGQDPTLPALTQFESAIFTLHRLIVLGTPGAVQRYSMVLIFM